MTSAGAWTSHYAALTQPEPYGASVTYRLAAEWLADCATVEDWGCGKGWLRQHVGPGRYRGVDGSPSPFADEVADLCSYRSNAAGIVLRHVLEHEYRWTDILDNACSSAAERLAVILFTPPVERTTVLKTEAAYRDVPVIAFRLDDITVRLPGTWTVETLDSPETAYGVETVIRVSL